MTGPGAPRIVCLGNLTIEDVFFPDGTQELKRLGGDTLYAALGARLWEPATDMVAPVGRDFPPDILRMLAQQGLAVEGLPQRAVPSLYCRVDIDHTRDRQIANISSDAEFLILSPTPADIPARFLNAEAFLVLAMSLEAQAALVPWLRSHTAGLVVLDLLETYVAGNEDRLQTLISQVDIVMPSAAEVTQLLGHADWLKAARELASWGPRLVVIKRGGDGAAVYAAATGEWIEVPAISRNVIDTTGAGDSYCGGFVAGYVQNPQDLRRAARMGAVSASFTVEGWGVNAILTATPAAARERLKQLAGEEFVNSGQQS